MPSRHLCAAHIKQRSTATEAERHDPNIVMLACVLGRDQAFECGDLTVDDRSVIDLGDPTNCAPLLGVRRSGLEEGARLQ